MCFSHGSSVNYSSVNESKTIKVVPLGDRPPLEVVHCMKLLLGLTVDSFLEYLLKSTLNLRYPVISFHGQIVPSQIVPQNSQIVPQNSQFVPHKLYLFSK